MSRPRVLFALEQVLGHVTQAHNLRRFVPAYDGIDARFVDVTFRQDGGLIERAPLPAIASASLRARMEVRSGLREGLPDAFFFNTQKVALFCPDYVRSRPSFMALDVTPIQYDAMGEAYGHEPDGNGPVVRLKHAWNKRLFGAATRLFPASHWAARSLEQDYGVAPDRISVVPPGVDTTIWTPALLEKGADEPLRILFVGGNFARKGGQLLLDWYLSSLDAEGCELHIVTRDEVRPGPGVFVYGDMVNNSDALVALTRSCDLFVLPTTADCFSLASMEAMACGLPAITTTVGGIPDIIEDGVSGRLIPPGDAAALAAAIAPLVRDRPRLAAMARAARARIEQRFDARQNTGQLVAEMLTSLEELTARTAPARAV